MRACCKHCGAWIGKPTEPGAAPQAAAGFTALVEDLLKHIGKKHTERYEKLAGVMGLSALLLVATEDCTFEDHAVDSVIANLAGVLAEKLKGVLGTVAPPQSLP